MRIKKCSKLSNGSYTFEVDLDAKEAEYLFNYALNDLIKAGFMHFDLIDEAQFEYDLFKDSGGETS